MACAERMRRSCFLCGVWGASRADAFAMERFLAVKARAPEDLMRSLAEVGADDPVVAQHGVGRRAVPPLARRCRGARGVCRGCGAPVSKAFEYVREPVIAHAPFLPAESGRRMMHPASPPMSPTTRTYNAFTHRMRTHTYTNKPSFTNGHASLRPVRVAHADVAHERRQITVAPATRLISTTTHLADTLGSCQAVRAWSAPRNKYGQLGQNSRWNGQPRRMHGGRRARPKDRAFTVVDISGVPEERLADGVHFDSEGYGAFARAVFAAVARRQR